MSRVIFSTDESTDPPVTVSAPQFESEVEAHLKAFGVPFVAHPRLVGVEPDFLIGTEDGHQIVVEAKSFLPGPSIETVIDQMTLYVDRMEADVGLIVVPDGVHWAEDKGAPARIRFVTLGDFDNELAEILATPTAGGQSGLVPSSSGDLDF